MTTRRANRLPWLVLLAGACLSLGMAHEAFAQIPAGALPKKNKANQPQKKSEPTRGEEIKPGEPWVDKLIAKGREEQYTAIVEIALTAFNAQRDRSKLPNTAPLKFDSAVVVFPIPEKTAASRFIPASFKGDLQFDGQKVDMEPEFVKNYHSGTRLARWEARKQDGTDLRLRIEIPMAIWNTRLDESLAMEIPWPKGAWPEASASTFKPQMYVDYIFRDSERAENAKYFAAKAAEWLDQADPKKSPPVKVAKILLGKMVEHFQISGDGLTFNDNASFEGFNLKGARQALEDGRGSEHDMVCGLVAIYRAAGLPARTVIGLDISEGSKPSGTSARRKLHSWAEFCVIDPGDNKEIWIPVDPQRLRKNSSRPPGLEREWKFFGTHDELGSYLPLAFQYHPPTTVIAHGAPCMWGWVTTPTIQMAEQSIRFQTMTRARRAGDDQPGK